MLLIDFAKLSPQCLGTTMADLGMADFNNLPFLTVLERLGLESNRTPQEDFSIQQASGKIDLSVTIQTLRQEKKVADVIGPTKIPAHMPVCFSTFVGMKPKEYLISYIEVAKTLCESSSDLLFLLWLEDTLVTLKNNWDAPTAKKAVDAYMTFFTQELQKFPKAKILLSSLVAPVGIPQSFAENLSRITTEELLSVMPFHLRNPMFVKTLDVVHFAWNCYVLYKLPCVNLAGVNNKRHFQLFRKVVGTKMTTILLPLGSESTLT